MQKNNESRFADAAVMSAGEVGVTLYVDTRLQIKAGASHRLCFNDLDE